MSGNAGNPLPTTDKPAQDVRKTVGVVTDVAIQAAENALIAAQPWLAWPVIKQIWENAFNFFLSQLGQFMSISAGNLVIDAQEYLDLKKAAQTLVDLNAAKVKGDPGAISQASAAADDAAASVIHYFGDSRGK